jgi:hypothetical protein
MVITMTQSGPQFEERLMRLMIREGWGNILGVMEIKRRRRLSGGLITQNLGKLRAPFIAGEGID